MSRLGIALKELVVFLMVIGGGCMQEHSVDSAGDVLVGKMDPFIKNQLSLKRILFCHQSVGANILEGITGLGPFNIKMNIIDRRVGKNGDPCSKLEDFKVIVRNEASSGINVAAFKFCYIDIDHSTDISELFRKYTAVFAELRTAYPQVKFVHCTVPLRSEPSRLKAAIRELLRRPNVQHLDNQARESFNSLVRGRYGPEHAVFDLALVEATGERYFDNKSVLTFGHRALLPCLSDDGGHLNSRGKRILAEAFVLFMSDISR